MAMNDLVVLLDVDNTLLDNDLVRARLEQALADVLGAEHADRFWEIYEAVREELDFVNFPNVEAHPRQEVRDDRESSSLISFTLALVSSDIGCNPPDLTIDSASRPPTLLRSGPERQARLASLTNERRRPTIWLPTQKGGHRS